MESLWEAGVALASLAYSLYKFWEFWQSKKSEADMQGVSIIRMAVGAAVNAVYTECIRKWKAEAPKLTDDQRAEALSKAAEYATKIAADHGLDIGKTLTPAELLDLIEQTVRTRKK